MAVINYKKDNQIYYMNSDVYVSCYSPDRSDFIKSHHILTEDFYTRFRKRKRVVFGG